LTNHREQEGVEGEGFADPMLKKTGGQTVEDRKPAWNLGTPRVEISVLKKKGEKESEKIKRVH